MATKKAALAPLFLCVRQPGPPMPGLAGDQPAGGASALNTWAITSDSSSSENGLVI